MQGNYAYKFNVYILGDSIVGKSSISTQAAENLFVEKYNASIGLDFKGKKINYDNKIFKILIWDTTGSSRYRNIIYSSFRGAQGAILVYDITNRESFLKISEHLELCVQRGNHDLSLILVGNKFDLEQNREVSYAEGQKFAKEYNLTFLEVSAYTGYNIEELFNQITQIIYKKTKKELSNEGEQYKLSKQGPPRFSSKCI